MLIYVRWVPARSGRPERLVGRVVSDQEFLRRSFMTGRAYSYDDGAGSTTQQACEVAREVSRCFSAYEAQELGIPGNASVSTRPVAGDSTGWYFLRQSYDRAPVCMQDVG